MGFLNADVMPELSSYETDSYVQYKWDTIQVLHQPGLVTMPPERVHLLRWLRVRPGVH